ncbi:unnamed protein product, partial [Tuber aestivum]
YLVFSPVSEEQLAKIERLRDANYKQLHFLYINPAQTLIVKLLPGPIHEAATSEFGRMLWKKIARMGADLDEDLRDMRGTRYKGVSSSKEADSAFRPNSSRPDKANWPTVVVECGVSETLERLRVDAKWWLHNSFRDVHIVLLFAIKEIGQEILIEQWELCPTENQAITRLHSKDIIEIPTCTASFNILPPVVIREGIKLNFEKIFARKPLKGSLEKDIEFTRRDLEKWAQMVWE